MSKIHYHQWEAGQSFEVIINPMLDMDESTRFCLKKLQTKGNMKL
jgi:hypothetical protein